jgi:hypothetical protein
MRHSHFTSTRIARASIEMHSDPGHVAVAINDGKYKFTLPDGQSVEAELKAGQAMFMDPIEHTMEVTESTAPDPRSNRTP